MSTTKKTIGIFWRYTRRYKGLFWAGSVGAVLAVICQDIVPPFVIARTFSKLQTAYALHTDLAFANFLPYIITYIVSILLGVALWRLQTYAVWEFEIRAVRDMVIDIFNHIQRLGQKFHADRFGGGLVSQANKFAGGYEKFMDELIWSILSGMTAIIVSLAVVTFVSWKFAVIMLGVIGFYVAVMSRLTRKGLILNARAAQTDSERTAAIADTITNVATVRAFGREQYELERFSKVANNGYRAYKRLSNVDFVNSSVSHSITSTFRIVAFLFGIFAITMWHANAGILYLVISYTTGIVDRLWQFSRVTRNISRSLGDASEMTEILGLKPEIKDPEHPAPSHIQRGDIVFRNVRFSHDSGARGVLFDDLSIHIKPGEKIGLVGPSGGGKTTFTSLLLRFIDIQSGEIVIDGQNITSIKQEELRNSISYVPQEPILFHRTLAENIRYGNLEASDRQLKIIAKYAHADEFIDALPQGFDTYVGERGVKLSGGQRQRIAIARAMLKNAPILVLDEATSALDSESEVLIQDALWRLMENRTAIVIAHRLSTIQKMDRIVVMDDGKIAEQGSHRELLQKNGIYAKLWAHQSGGFLKE